LPSNVPESGKWGRIGQIVGSFGLKGHVKVTPFTDFTERFDAGTRLRLKDDWITIETVSEHKGHLILKLSGVTNRTAAEALQWNFLEGDITERPELEKDEYFTSDLIGLIAETTDGEILGPVGSILPSPAHDTLVIGEIMVPAVKQFVKLVDVKAKRIVLQLIPGMRPGEE
jgi:16S rRNA processing protein RimM